MDVYGNLITRNLIKPVDSRTLSSPNVRPSRQPNGHGEGVTDTENGNARFGPEPQADAIYTGFTDSLSPNERVPPPSTQPKKPFLVITEGARAYAHPTEHA